MLNAPGFRLSTVFQLDLFTVVSSLNSMEETTCSHRTIVLGLEYKYTVEV